MEEEKEKYLNAILAWASVLTGENRLGGYYYITKPVERLEWRLKRTVGQLIALIGLQGTGKTSALYYVLDKLANEKKKTVFIKWTKGWRRKVIEQECFQILDNYVAEELSKQIEHCAYSHRRHRALGRVPQSGDWKDYVLRKIMDRVDFKYDLLIGKGKLKECEEQALIEFLSQCEVISIDLPDYQKTDRRHMTRNLSEVQALWEKAKKWGSIPNIVIAIQKELFTGHFFFGKMYSIELKPLKPEEFLHVFRTQFSDSNDLVLDETLIFLGQLARGVFRRFLKYLNMTLEEFAISGDNPPIKPGHVNNAVTIDTIVKDMELELFDAFKDPNQRRQAVELLNHLREHGQLNQKEIADFLGVNMMTAARIVNKLYRYIERKRGKGREWLISLRS